MTLRISLGLLAVLAVALTATEQQPSACPAGTLFDYRSSGCVLVHDAMQDFAAKQKPDKPSRSRKAPVPGGLGAGTLYRQGRLQVVTSTNLDTEMVVHPEGMNMPPEWILSTATNRSDSGVEVAGMYYGRDLADVGIFDWSCSPTHPCQDGQTGPSWQRNVSMLSMGCQITRKSDGNPSGVQRQMMRYSNRTTKLAEGTPDTWRNDVYYWNYCTNGWDQVYTHTFASDQNDCSLTNQCGWWGPIIETFFGGSPEQPDQPILKPIAFHNIELFLNGSTATGAINPDNTVFEQPLPVWTLFHLIPNWSWSAGSPEDQLPPDRNLAIASFTDTPDPVGANQPVTYALAVQNTGSDIVNNAVVSVTFPSNATIQSSVPSQGSCSVAGTVVTCALGSMSGGQMLNVSVTVSYTSGNGNGKGQGKGKGKTVTVTAVVDPSNAVDETNETDNIATQQTRIN